MKSRKYQIHDNGGRCFLVEDFYDDKFVTIYIPYLNKDLSYDEFWEMVNKKSNKNNDVPKKFFTPLCEIDYLRFFPGKNYYNSGDHIEWDKKQDGNNCLIQLDETRFIQIDRKISVFKLPKNEEIEEYLSFVGDNDTPRAYLITDKRYLSFDSFAYYSREKLDNIKCDVPIDNPYLRKYKCARKMSGTRLGNRCLYDSRQKVLDIPAPSRIKTLPIEFFKENFDKEFYRKQHSI